MNKIAAVVVTYNRLELLKQCVESLKKQTVPCDILLVNNNSTDSTEEWAASVSKDNLKENNKIKYRNTGANIGGAGGFNFGMRWAVEAGYAASEARRTQRPHRHQRPGRGRQRPRKV